MIYCKSCVMSDTRPGIELDLASECNACRIVRSKDDGGIDWDARMQELRALAEVAKRRKRGAWDCVVPVSGGKDSIYQLHVAKEVLGLKPLAVTYECPCRTETGERNLRAVKRMADHEQFSLDERVSGAVMRKTLEECGDCCWVCHRLMFSYPIKVAMERGIPLVIYGENSQLEYGGAEDEARNTDLDTDWLVAQGIQHGKSERDLVDGVEISEADAAPMRLPSMDEIRAAGVRSVFLGAYMRWDTQQNVQVAQRYGFERRPDGPPEGSLYDFKDIDCEFMTFHHYFKWLKFGFSRVTDHACIEIRDGRMTREQALREIAEREGEEPRESMERFCDHLGISEARFWEIADSYRDLRIWERGSYGEWRLPEFICAEERGWKRED